VEVTHDHVVVGSGMTGAHAAQTLLERGRRVLMLDVGVRETRYAPLVPAADFLTVRERETEQHRYFLGDRFEGVPWGPAAHTLTPPRQHLVEGTGRWLPLRARAFRAMESLCYGGLGAGWGAGCAVYTTLELAAMGLDPAALAPAYEIIGRRIGLAAQADDATPYCGAGLETFQPPLAMDASIAALYAQYERKRAALRRAGIVMGKMPMAVLTRARGERGGTRYTDMEFWADHDLAVYRPWMTVEELKRREGFEYRDGRLVVSFAEAADHVEIRTRRVDGGADESFRARRLVLGAGTLGTARIVLRSQPGDAALPLLSNPYCIAPALHLRRLGAAMERERTSLGQLEMFLDPRGDGLDVRMVSLYTYRSLLLFKLVKEVPLGFADARVLMQHLLPAIVLVTINHPDHASAEKRLRRVADPQAPTGDALEVDYTLGADEARANHESEGRILAALAQLGCRALKRQHMPAGSTVHYAGTLPFGDGQRRYTVAADGRLAGTRRVFVADGSPFRYLPGNGLTFTLMAWAHVVAEGLARRSDGD
jgi:choline dehydrogenase-like flavoprotein